MSALPVRTILPLLAVLSSLSFAHAGTPNRLVRWVEALTTPELKGRATGHDGAQTRTILTAALTELDLIPEGQHGFEVAVTVPWKIHATTRLAIGDMHLAPGIEYQAANFSDSGAWMGQPVFVGYGISAPDLGFDEYADMDVRGKLVIVLTGVPPKLQSQFEQYGTPAAKAAVALAHGAKGVLLVNDPQHYGAGTGQKPDDIPRLKPERPLQQVLVARVPHRVMSRAVPELDLEAAQTRLDALQPASRPLQTVVDLELSVRREHTSATSLVARVPGSSGPPLLLMAHYDGLAPGAHDGPPPYLGADDNASGVSVLLEVAARLAAKPTSSHTVFIVLHDAEELGLLGSTRTAHFLRDRGIVGPVINLDMVGRLGEPGLQIYGDCAPLQGLTDLPTTCAPAHDSHSDHLPYGRLGYPMTSLSTGRGTHYHHSTDTPDRLDFEGMRKVADLIEHRARQ